MDEETSPYSVRNLLKKADACVVCGLCLPHCPTYQLEQTEGESPRGRIQLMRAVLREELPVSPQFISHIDQCLTCRNCERVCPNQVEYGALVDGMRFRLREAGHAVPRQASHTALARCLAQPAAKPFIQAGLLLGQTLAKGWLPKAWRAYLQGVERVRPVRLKKYYPAPNAQAEILWFTGCITSVVEQSATLDAIYLLNQCGYSVHIPATQACCGALLQHEGRDNRFLLEQNQQAFSSPAFADLAILSLATGCTAQLQETALHHHKRVWDVMQFLAEKATDRWQTLLFQALPVTVLLHMPCSQRNVLKESQSTRQLLQSIPQLSVQSLTSTGCCGAAGLYHLHHPDTAQALRSQQLAQLPTQGERYILSQNVGCSMWLRGESPIPILHPIRLLAQQHRAAVDKKDCRPSKISQ